MALCNLGNLLDQWGVRVEAYTAYADALEADPTNGDAARDIAELLRRRLGHRLPPSGGTWLPSTAQYVAMAQSLRQRTAEVAGAAAADRRPVVPRQASSPTTNAEEDATMESGKLDEELGRVSAIAGQITRHSILLCNESFAATNEREGSEIARQVVRAMLTSTSRSSSSPTCTTSRTASTPSSLATPFSCAPSGSRTDQRTFRLTEGRAAADQLRRGLLPARLRRRRTSGDGRRDGRRGEGSVLMAECRRHAALPPTRRVGPMGYLAVPTRPRCFAGTRRDPPPGG